MSALLLALALGAFAQDDEAAGLDVAPGLRSGDPAALEAALVAAESGRLRGEALDRVVQAIRSWAPASVLPRLKTALDRSTDPAVRAGLIRALALLGGGSMVPVLARHLDGAGKEAAEAAAEAVFGHARKVHADLLRTLLKHERAAYRVRAAETLLALDLKDGLETLGAELKDIRSAERLKAVEILSRFRRKECVDLLLERLDDEDARLAAEARKGALASLAVLYPYLTFDSTTPSETLKTWWAKQRVAR